MNIRITINCDLGGAVLCSVKVFKAAKSRSKVTSIGYVDD
jgi:hypothetical protein